MPLLQNKSYYWNRTQESHLSPHEPIWDGHPPLKRSFFEWMFSITLNNFPTEILSTVSTWTGDKSILSAGWDPSSVLLSCQSNTLYKCITIENSPRGVE